MGEINDWNVAAGSNNDPSPDGAPEGMFPSGVNNTMRENMAVLARWNKDINGSVIVAGTNTYTATVNATTGFTLYNGYMFCGTFTNTNTGAATLNLTVVATPLGAKPIVNPDGTALTGGEIPAGAKVAFKYDGTSFRMDASLSTAIADGSITTAKIADAAVTAAKIDPSVELGGPSLGSRSVIRVNEKNIREDITIYENYSAAVTIDTGAETINKGTDDGWANGDRLQFTATALPTGISAATDYYVVGVTATTLQVSTTYGGAAFNFTDTGTTVNIYKPINAVTFGPSTTESGFSITIPDGSTFFKVQEATQAEQEAATVTDTIVTPNSQKYNPHSIKAYVNLNGTGTPAARASLNLSSITDNGTGDYTINFTNNFADIDYNPAGAGGWQQSNSSSSGVGYHRNGANGQEVAPTVSALRVNGLNSSGNASDEKYIHTNITGVLA